MHRLRAPRASLLPLVVSGLAVACGSPPPPPAAPPPSAPVATAPREEPIDTSPVPEPEGLLARARVSRPDMIASVVASWTGIPLPTGSALVHAIAEEPVADVVDPSQPVDAVVSVTPSRHVVDFHTAFAVPVKSYEQAKARLGTAHRLTPVVNGQLWVHGFSFASRDGGGPAGRASPDEDADEREGCMLAPATTGARLVCGERDAVEALAPYLSRTMPREQWSSDVHVELHPEPIRSVAQHLRAMAPLLSGKLLGASPALHDLADAAIGELMDVVADAQKLTADAQIADSGMVVTTRVDFQSNRSVVSRMLTANHGAAAPAAFWRLPAETDTAFFGQGSDPKLFEHPRELLSSALLEAAEAASMPEPERRALKELLGDRLLGVVVAGPTVYGKGFDAAAVANARAALDAVKPGDEAALGEKRLATLEQVAGWHLFQASEPIAKVGPMLKDVAGLWGRPAFAKWLKGSTSTERALARLRIAPAPAGVALPKGTVHLEITVPRKDVYADSGAKHAKSAPKKISVRPVLLHVLAVPDGGATWLAFGLDGKLVAQKVGAAAAGAPAAGSLGKAAGIEALREGALNGGGFTTLRGLTLLTALASSGDRDAFVRVAALPHKGTTPVIVSGLAETPSDAARGGASVGTLRIPRAVIEDLVKLVMSRR
jgi:hypothetical protein